MVIGISGNLICLVFNVWAFAAGKFVFGFGTGLFCPVIPKYIEETVPAHLFEPLCALYLAAQSTGGLIAFMSGAILPKNSDKEALKATNIWIYPFIVYPAAS